MRHAKTRWLVALLCLALSPTTALTQKMNRKESAASQEPLNKVQVLGWLTDKVFSQYLAMLADQRGIDFEPTEVYLESLRAAGAEDVLLAALLTAKYVRPSTAESTNRAKDPVLQHLERGAELTYKGDYAQAEEELRAAVALEPGSAALRLALFPALVAQRKADEALVEVQEAVRLQPNEAELHQKLSVALKHVIGDLEGAIAEQREAVRLEPEYSERHYNLGVVLQNKGDWDEAITEYREALRLQPDLVDAHFNVGAILEGIEGRGDLDAAISEYREELHLHPEHALAHFRLGSVLAMKGDPDGALVELREAVRLEPDNVRARLGIASTLAYKGKLGGALVELLKIPTVAGFALFVVVLITVLSIRRKHRKDRLTGAR